MTAHKLRHYRRLLLDERVRTRRDLGGAEQELRDAAEIEPIGSLPDPLDVVNQRMAGEAEADTVSRESDELTEIDEALRSIYHSPESFGRCEICHRRIPRARLEVLPATRRCTRHAAGHRISA